MKGYLLLISLLTSFTRLTVTFFYRKPNNRSVHPIGPSDAISKEDSRKSAFTLVPGFLQRNQQKSSGGPEDQHNVTVINPEASSDRCCPPADDGCESPPGFLSDFFFRRDSPRPPVVRDQGSGAPGTNPPLLPRFRRGLARAAGEAMAGFGFATSLSASLFHSRGHFRRLQPTVQAMRSYLRETGISRELGRTFSARMYDNVVILWRIQRRYRATHDLRDLVLLNGNHPTIPAMEEASRYMRFATAAYGDQMISAVRWGRRARSRAKLLPSTRERISEHVDVPVEDILIMDLDFGGQREHLHHFVATDHAHKAVVLAIRGTFSIPDMIVDAAGFSRPFCGGEAHATMAEMAELTWQAARPHVVSALERHGDYSLVITGHSLGAGVASLVNVLCHRRGREEVKGRRVRCFAYGCPPVYSPLELAPGAVASAACYVHGNDIVPFLSVSAVRRLVSTLAVIDGEASKRAGSRPGFVRGTIKPSKKMVAAALQGVTKVPKKGAPTLAPPASCVVWTRETSSSSGGCHFDYKVCDARKVTTLSIPISKHAMTDHSLTSYEEALHYLEEQERAARSALSCSDKKAAVLPARKFDPIDKQTNTSKS